MVIKQIDKRVLIQKKKDKGVLFFLFSRPITERILVVKIKISQKKKFAVKKNFDSQN